MKKYSLLYISLFSLLFSCYAYAETRANNFLTNDTTEYTPSYAVTPLIGETITNSDYGNVLKRMTDVADLPAATNQNCLRSSYATQFSTENSDGTRLMVTTCEASTVHIYDITTETSTFVSTITYDGNALAGDSSNRVLTESERWDPSGNYPRRLYFTHGTKLYYKTDADDNSVQVEVHDFAVDMTGGARITTTDWDGAEPNFDCNLLTVAAESPMVSNDGTKFAFMCQDTETGGSFQPIAMLSYNMTTDTAYALEMSDFGAANNTRFCSTNTVSVTPDGDGVLIHSSRPYSGTCPFTAGLIDTYLDGPHIFPFDFDLGKYSTGTCTFTNGSTTVDCAGTDFTGDAIIGGDYAQARGQYNEDWGSTAATDTDQGGRNAEWIEIASITDFNTFEMVSNYDGDTTVASAYNVAVFPISHISPDATHWGWGRDLSGEQIVWMQNDRTDWMQWSDMQGHWTNIWDEGAFSYPAIHQLNTSYDTGKNGYVAASWYAEDNVPAYTNNQIVFWELDAAANSPDFIRMSIKYTDDSLVGECVGDCLEFHANLSMSGNNIYWGSNFNNQFDDDTANTSEVLRTRLPVDWLGTTNVDYLYDLQTGESSDVSFTDVEFTN